MDSYDDLDVESHGDGVWLLRLNRPDVRNALSTALRDHVSEAVETLAIRPDVGALVLTAAGTTFSAGFDLAEFGDAAEDPTLNTSLWASSDRFHHTMLRCPVPVICALNGPAIAGGFDLAVMCDIRMAQPGVWFARPEVGFATPLFGPLRELVGGARARELCLTSRRVELDEAARIGLVNVVTVDGRVCEQALEMAREIASRPRDAVRALKAKMVDVTGLGARRTLAL